MTGHTLPPLLKLPSRKIGALICSMKFHSFEFVIISVNPPSGLALNPVVRYVLVQLLFYYVGQAAETSIRD